MTKEEKEELARQKEYEDFRGPIDPPKEGSIRERQNAYDNYIISSLRNDRNNLAYIDDTKATPIYGEWSDLGNSSHDPADNIMNPIEGQGELNEIRANDQGFFEKVGLGAVKMTTTAATTFLDGTVGFLWGIGSVINNKKLGSFYDNDFTNAMQDFNEWCEEKMPHYSSKYESWGLDFWGNFIGKDILQNMGFQIGTGLSMMVPGLGEAGLAKTGLSITKNLAKFTSLTRARAASTAFKDLITSTYAAVGESSIEALQNKRDFVKYQNQLNNDNFQKQNQMLDAEWRMFVMQNYGGDERLATRSQEYLDYVQKKNNLIAEKNNKDRFVQQEADKVGDMTFMANMAIVGASNYITFGKAVAGGMGLFKRMSPTVTDIVDKETQKVLAKNVSKRTAIDVIEKGKYAVKDKTTGEKILRNAITQERGRTKSPLINTIKDAVSEGLEEMNQSVASEWFSGAAEEDMLNYDALTRNGMAYDDVVNNINQSWMSWGNMAKAIGKVYTDPSQWRQFFSGMIGVGLSPHFRKGSDGKLHFKLNNIGEQNAEINAYNSTNSIIAENINRVLNSDESQNYIKGLVRHKALDYAKYGAVALDSKMDYQDADFAQFVSDISMLSDAGKLDLFRAQLSSVKRMSDEELEDYCTKLCTDVNGKKVGEFVDANGNYIGTSDQARMDIRKKINRRVDQLLSDMETYQKAINEIDDKTGGTISRENLATFAWEKANISNKFNRAKSILGSDASARNIASVKDKLGLMLKSNTDQLKTVKDSLNKERQRIADANKNAEAAGVAKIDKSDFQKELEDDIETLTQNINVATEVSQLIADLEMMQMQSPDMNPTAEIKKLFSKYADLRDSMPEVAKIYELNDKKTMSLESLMYSGMLNRFLGWATNSTIDETELDNDYQDSAKLYKRGLDIEKSLDNILKNPERYESERTEMERKILERENADTIKAIEDEIKKALDDGSMNFGNIDQRSREIVENLKSAKDEKNTARRLFRNAVNMLKDTPFDSLRRIAIENVFNSKKYKHMKDFRRFVNYVYVRIASANASDEAKIASQKFFNDFISDKKTVDECLKDKFYPDDIDVSDLYKDNYTPESYANAELVQNESYQLLKNAFRAFAMDYYSPKLNIDKYDLSNIDKSARSIKNKEQQDIIDEKMAKIESKLKDYINNFADGSIISNDDQNKVAEHIENTVEAEFNPENFNEELRDGIERAKIELKINLLKYFSKNINDRITKFYENSEKKEEGKKTNREKLTDAKKEIDNTVNSINKKSHNVEVNVFNTTFDKISNPDGSMEIRDYKEGYYVENGNVMRGNLVPCNVTFNGSNTSEKHYAVFINDDSGVKINIISDSGEIIGFRHVREFKNNSKGNLNIKGVQRANGASLNDIERIEFLEKKNDILNDQQNRMQKAREQASVEVLEANGTMDENGKVDVSQNLHNSAVTVNAIMDDNITQSKKDIDDIRESAKLPEYHRFDSEYMVIYDYENDEIYKAKLPATGNRIIVRTINGKEQQIKFSDKELYDKGFGGILASNFGDTVDILYSSEEEWTGKKSEPKTEEKVETKPVVEIKNESNEKDDFDYTTIFNLNGIDGSKVEVETISKPWKKDPSKKNRSMNIYLKGEKDKGYYQLVKDHEDGFYSVHFKTNNGQHTKTDVKPSTKEERAILYQQLINAIPEGGKVSTWGEISKGGIIALNKVGKNMKNVGMRTISLDDEAHTPVEIPIFEKTPAQEQPAKPVETPKQKAKKEAKQKAKNTASELSKQLAKLEQMEKDLEDAVKNNPDYADTLHSVRTFKNYVQLVRDNYEEMGRPEKVVIDANAIWSINNKLTENLKAIFGNDNVLVLSDEEIEKNLTGNEQFSASKGNKNENLTFNVIDKAIESGEWNQEALDELNNLITDIKDGKKEYRRYQLGIPRTIQQKGWRSDETAVKASIILRGSSDPSSTEQRLSKLQRRKRDQETGIRQEQIVESWARSEGLWFEQLSDSVKGLKLLSDKSSESAVYIDEAKRTVTKVMSLSHFINPQLAIDRIILHNQFFPKAPIKIIGFGIDKNEEFIKDVMNNNNKFRIVIEQPFAKGIKPTIENIKSVVENFGLIQQKTPTTYSNPLFIASDLHEGNAIHLVDENDNPIYYENGEPVLAFIDTDMRLNTPDQGQNGEYHIDNSIVELSTGTVVAVYNSNQIKSATDNNGDFSKENDNIYLSKQNGEIFGYTADGKIVLNKDRIRIDTPVHEYTHLWDQAVQRINPEFWNQGKELMKDHPEWQKVINDKAYENIKDDEDKVASEVHSRLAGYIAAGKSVELYAKDRTKDKRNWFKRLIDWFMEFKDFTLKNIFNMSSSDCKQVSLEQFLNAPVADFFMQTDPRKIGKEEIVVQEEAKPVEDKKRTEESNEVKYDKNSNPILTTEYEKDASVLFRIAMSIINNKDFESKNFIGTSFVKYTAPIPALGMGGGHSWIEQRKESALGKIIEYFNPNLEYFTTSMSTGVSVHVGGMFLGLIREKNNPKVEHGSPSNLLFSKNNYKILGFNNKDELIDALVDLYENGPKQSTEPATTEEQTETKPPFSDEDLSAVDEYDKQQAELEKRLLEAEDLANEVQEEIDKQSAPPDIEPIDDSSINTAPPDFDSKTVDFVEDKINNLNSQMPDNPAQNLSQPQYTNTMRNISRAGVNTQRRDSFKPELSEFDFDDANKSSLATLGDNYKYIWNLYNALGAWDYVKQGKLKVNDEIYFGYGKIGESSDGKTQFNNVVMFTKDSNGEYQFLGTLDYRQDNPNPESAIKLKQDIEGYAKKRDKRFFETITVKAKTASGDFASGQEFKFSLVKTPDGRHLTTNVSKILKGELMKTENQYRSLNDVITPNGQKDFNLCFFTDDGLVSNLEIPEGKTVSFVNPKSARLGHVSLMVDMPTGNIQLVPLNVATFGEINKSGNKVAGRVLSILKDAFDLYQSDMSVMDKNTELTKKLADNGVIQRLKHTLHFDDFKLFFNDNGTISVGVNDRPIVTFAPKGIVEFLDTMTEEFNNLLININSSVINNKETLDEYVKSNVFTTSLSDTQYRNSFFTTVPVNSSGIKLDARRDIPDNTILTMNNIKQMIMKVAESNTHEFWVVETNNGDTTVLAKMNNFDMFDEDTVLKNFTPEQRFRMISYAMLRNGISDNKYDRIEEECYVNDSEYSVEMLVHKTIHGDEFWYDTTTWQKVDPSSIKYIEYTDSERITKSASERVKTPQPVELSAEEDDLMSALENLPPQQKPVSEPKADIESHIAKIMTVDFCKPLFRCGIITDFYDCLFVRRNQPICREVMEILGPENMDAIFEMFKYYNPNFLVDINELMVADRFDEDTEDLDEEFESSYELLSEEAIRKILENRKIQKDSPLDLVNQKNDECPF